jgi:hypothetical protein
MRRIDYLLAVVFAVVVCCALVPAASAFTATSTAPADGADIHSGTTITIHIDGLAVTDSFKYQITSSNLDTPTNSVTLSSVTMPFTFSDGTASTSLTTTGISGPATLTVRRLSDSTELVLSGNNPITSSKNIKKDNYFVSITGTKTGDPLGIDYSVAGTVGALDSPSNDLSFTLADVNSGSITIKIFEGATSRFEKTYAITLYDPPRPGGGGDDTGVGGAPAAPEAPAAPVMAMEQLAPMQGTTPTTATIAHNEEGKALADYSIATDPAAGFSSQIDINAGTTIVMGPETPNPGQPVSEISITPLDPATVTAATATSGTFSFSGLSVECEPTGATFSGGTATISFSMTGAQWAEALSQVNGNIAAMTIQTFDPATNAWVEVPTVVDPVTHTVSAQVTHFSMYALFYKSEAAGESVKTIGELAQVTPVQTRMTTAAPVVTPAPTQMAPVETPAQQGGIFDGIINWFNSLFGKK